MQEVKISIIVPVYNAEHYIKRCLLSILNQSYSNWECILVDDGSTDASPKLCDEFATKSGDRIKVMHKENEGVSVARNVGIESANGEVIVFLDADDWLEEKALETIAQYWNDQIDILIYDMWEVFGNEKKQLKLFKKNVVDFAHDDYYDIHILRRAVLSDYSDVYGTTSSCGAIGGKAYRRAFLEEEGILFVKGSVEAEDAVFNAQCVYNTKRIKYVSVPLYNYYLNEQSASTEEGYRRLGVKILDSVNKSWCALEKMDCDEGDRKELLRLYAILAIKLILWWAVDEPDKKKAQQGFLFCKEKANYIEQQPQSKMTRVNSILIGLCKLNLFGVIKCGVKAHRLYKRIMKVR